jgi:hypothetical protein
MDKSKIALGAVVVIGVVMAVLGVRELAKR